MFPPLRHIAPQLSGRVPAALNFLTVHSGLLVCALFLLAGSALLGDYGTHNDEEEQRRIARANLDYILGRADAVDATTLATYTDRVYGVAFELPLLLAEEALSATDFPDPHRIRFFLTHLLFIIGGYFCYRLAYRLFNNRLIALLSLLIFLLHPRIYAYSFFNSKDPVFLSAFVIALYLLERTFRKDTVGAFVLLGLAVGVLINLRIFGLMLLAATLGMRGLDLFYAETWPRRREILLIAGLFVLAAGLTLYAVTPYAWSRPIEYLAANLDLTVNHPTILPELFQGDLLLSNELPPHYAATWFAITTPPPLLLLGGLGAAVTAAAVLRRPGALFRNTRLRLLALLLPCFLLPPLAAAALGSNQYDGWRHLYFLYAPLCLLAAGGLYWLGLAAARFRPGYWRAGVYGLAGSALALVLLQMTQIHPLQDIYFNFLVDRTTPEYLRTRYEMHSITSPREPVLEYLREQHPGEALAVRGVRRDLLPPALQPGFQDSRDFTAADYALFHVGDDGHQDLAFNSLPVGRLYNNTFLAVKPLRASRMSAAALAAYQELYRQAVAGEPIIRAAYDVYHQGRNLTFIRENCQWGDRERRVFVQIILPDLARATGAGITLRSPGVRWGDTCLAVIKLPDYVQEDLIVGQDKGVAEGWAELYSLSRPGLRERIATARLKNRQPSLRGDFDVFLEQDAAGRNWLLYAKADCSVEEYRAGVALHIYPAPAAGRPYAPESYRERDHENRDFNLYLYGGRPGGECLAKVPLPDYPLREIRTGQPGHWNGSLYPPGNPEPLRAAYAALSAVPPDQRAAFDVYWREGQLTYIRESCAAADTADPFFLHILPAAADLPAGSAAGRDNRDFDFGRWGGSFDGKCLAAVPLPDYPIKEIRTGQYAPGQGGRWSVELIAPADPAHLRAEYAALAAAEPVAQGYFDLYALDNRLIYLRESCIAADTAAGFFLHIIPQDIADLPAARRAAGFAHAGFNFARQGGHFDGKCLAAVSLPNYPIKEMRTGQHIPGQGDLWSLELIAAPDFDQLRADYTALAAAMPVARSNFDLYWQGNRLLYLRETCAAGDTAAGFFLHIVPADLADLPAERRAAGFAHGGFEFVRQGGHFDGKCLAAVSLQDYPIKEMRTGQHIPGQGDLWSVELRAAP